jgi:protein O-mannosyl-transferase
LRERTPGIVLQRHYNFRVTRRRGRPQRAAAPVAAPTFDRRQLWIPLALTALAAIAYAAVRNHGFVPLDDPLYVSENPHVLTGLSWENVRWAFTTRWASYRIPFTWLSYMVDVQFFGPGPGMIHVTNVLLHIANTWLLFFWLWRATGREWRSGLVAGLFALHPLHVESVAWITERKDVLSTLFLLLTLHAYTTYVKKRSRRAYIAVFVWAIAGLLAKPMLVTLPPLLLLCDLWPFERVRLTEWAGWGAVIREKVPLIAVAAAASAIAFLTQEHARVANEVFPLGLRSANAVVAYVIYLRQTIWPTGLIVNYTYLTSIPVWKVAASAAVLIVASFAAWRLGRARPYVATGWFWYLGTLVPVIGLVQVGLQPYADRFTYVPLIGIFIVIAWAAGDVVETRPSLKWGISTAAGIALLACTVGAQQQVQYWKNGVTLWTRAIAVTPPDQAAQQRYELGAELYRQHRPTEAIPHLMEAIRVQPSFTGAHAELGDALNAAGRTAEAQLEYEAALRLDDGLPEIHNNVGAILASAGKIEQALPHFEAAVRHKPDLELAQVNLGAALMRLGRRDDAIRALTAALRLNPSNAQAQRLLEILRK